MKPGQIAEEFLKGCGNLLFAGVMIGLCNAALIVLEDANIMDTIIHALAGLLDGLPPTLSACGMFVVQDLFNVLVPSGSGQAAITMPLMAPLADLIGLTRQTSGLAFQLGRIYYRLHLQGRTFGSLCNGKNSMGQVGKMAGTAVPVVVGSSICGIDYSSTDWVWTVLKNI